MKGKGSRSKSGTGTKGRPEQEFCFLHGHEKTKAEVTVRSQPDTVQEHGVTPPLPGSARSGTSRRNDGASISVARRKRGAVIPKSAVSLEIVFKAVSRLIQGGRKFFGLVLPIFWVLFSGGFLVRLLRGYNPSPVRTSSLNANLSFLRLGPSWVKGTKPFSNAPLWGLLEKGISPLSILLGGNRPNSLSIYLV